MTAPQSYGYGGYDMPHICFVSFNMYVLAPITHQILRKLIATTGMSLENIVPSERSQHKDHIL